MGDYVDIGGLDTWYDEDGSGEPLVLLHRGLCTNETWQSQTSAFAERFRVLARNGAATVTPRTWRGI